MEKVILSQPYFQMVSNHQEIFFYQREDIQLLRKLVENKVTNYLKEFSTSSEGFIKNWPKKYNIYGWLVSINSEETSQLIFIKKDG